MLDGKCTAPKVVEIGGSLGGRLVEATDEPFVQTIHDPAWAYYRENSQEIDVAIRRNSED